MMEMENPNTRKQSKKLEKQRLDLNPVKSDDNHFVEVELPHK